jgi:hypothetical protein
MIALLQPVWATLLGGAGGIVARLLPEAFDYLKKRQGLEQAKLDQAHELAVMDKQIELHRLAGQQRLGEIGALADGEVTRGAVEAARPVGIFLVDLLNGLVRPVVTYWFLGLYAACKTVWIAGLFSSCKATGSIAKILAAQESFQWGSPDMAVFCGILNFWFLDRVLKYKAQSR